MKIATHRITQTDIGRAMISPVSVFDLPSEVISSTCLSAQEKLQILKRWELDARALQRAADESMGGGEPTLLDEVNQALLQLDPHDATADDFGKVATKI